MKKFAWVFCIVAIFILSSCAKEEENIDSNFTQSWGKTPFSVSIRDSGNSSQLQEVTKAWRIVASSTLTITAQSAGEISKISVKEGQNVRAWSPLIAIKDTLTNLDLRLSQAENALEIQRAAEETTKANLDISIENARITLERAKQAYETLDSKNALSYATTVNSNEKTLDTYNGSYASYLADLDRNMTQLLFEWDKILGISPDFDSATDWWDPYLWVRIGDSRSLAVNAWNNLYTSRWLIRAKIEKWAKFDAKTATWDLDLLSTSYTTLRKYVDAMIYMLQNNVVGGGLSQVQQDGWMLAWNGYRAQIQWSDSGFNAWKSQIGNFLKSYTNNEIATKLAVKSLTSDLSEEEKNQIQMNNDLKLTYETTRIDLMDRMKSAKLSLEQAESGYKNALKLRDATLKQLAAATKSAELWLEQAKRDYAKLRPSSPVDAIVTKVLTNIWQSVNPGTPLMEIVWKQPEILVDIDNSLADALIVWDTVNVSIENITLTGTITALSKAAGANLLYTTRISVPEATKYLWEAVNITFYPNENLNHSEVFTLPLKSVKIISEQEWEIALLWSGGKLIFKSVRLGRIVGDSVIIEDTIWPDEKIILNDTTNFDAMKNYIVEKK